MKKLLIITLIGAGLTVPNAFSKIAGPKPGTPPSYYEDLALSDLAKARVNLSFVKDLLRQNNESEQKIAAVTKMLKDLNVVIKGLEKYTGRSGPMF